MRRMVVRGLPSAVAVLGGHYPVPQGLQEIPQRAEDIFIVIGDQNLRDHRISSYQIPAQQLLPEPYGTLSPHPIRDP